jgi:protein phosphatase
MKSNLIFGSNSEELGKFEGTQKEEFETHYFSIGNPMKSSGNEDGLGIFELDDGSLYFLVVDGLGGHEGGDKAAEITLKSFNEAFDFWNERNHSQPDRNINDVFMATNQKVMKEIPGAGTTAVLAEVFGDRLRIFHCGDSDCIVMNSEFLPKYKTQAHGPVGDMLARGELTEEEALVHHERHLVVNVIGDPDLDVEKSPEILIEQGDFIVLASDSLFDNFTFKDLRKHLLNRETQSVPEELHRLMLGKRRIYSEDIDTTEFAKADDMTFICSHIASLKES